MQTQGKITDIAIVTDVRGGALFNSLFDGLEELKKQGCDYKILFIDADDSVIKRRFKETRRKHPLSEVGTSIEDALAEERQILRPARERADYIIDTTNLSPAQLNSALLFCFLAITNPGCLSTVFLLALNMARRPKGISFLM